MYTSTHATHHTSPVSVIINDFWYKFNCSERVGWVPVMDDVPESVRDEYRWVEGLSVTEMEIMHGAYRRDNPNGYYLLQIFIFSFQDLHCWRKQFIIVYIYIYPSSLYLKFESLRKCWACTYQLDALWLCACCTKSFEVCSCHFNQDVTQLHYECSMYPNSSLFTCRGSKHLLLSVV